MSPGLFQVYRNSLTISLLSRFVVATFSISPHFTSFSALLYEERNRNKLPCKPGNELATFAIKLNRKKLQRILNKLHQTEIARKIVQKNTSPNFLNEKIPPNF